MRLFTFSICLFETGRSCNYNTISHGRPAPKPDENTHSLALPKWDQFKTQQLSFRKGSGAAQELFSRGLWCRGRSRDARKILKAQHILSFGGQRRSTL